MFRVIESLSCRPYPDTANREACDDNSALPPLRVAHGGRGTRRNSNS
jgi:hypothetical protein